MSKSFSIKSSINNFENILKELNINIRYNDGNFKNTYDVLKDISIAFNDMNEKEQDELCKKILGGIYE